MTDIDLSTVPLSALTAEIKRRRDEWESAQKDLVGFGVAPAAPASTTKRAKQVSDTTMKDAANERWKGWKQYKAQHPNANPKDYFKARAAAKAKIPHSIECVTT